MANVYYQNNKSKVEIWDFPGALELKDSALSQQWLSLDPWSGNFCIPWAWPKKKKRCKFIIIVDCCQGNQMPG